MVPAVARPALVIQASERYAGGTSLVRIRTAIPTPLSQNAPALSRWLAVLQDGQDVARRIGEPGDERAAAPADALGVLLRPLVAFEPYASPGQLVDGRVDVLDPEVEDGEAGRNVIGLRVDQRVPAAGQPQREQAVQLAHPQAERLGVELPGLVDITDG